MTAKDDERLRGRYPEFTRMSNRPGIGYDALHEVAASYMAFGLDEKDDLGNSLRHGAHVLPLGRYLHRRLRLMVGKDADCPESTKAAIKEELREVREAAFENNQSFADALAAAGAPRRLRLEKRQEIFSKRRVL